MTDREAARAAAAPRQLRGIIEALTEGVVIVRADGTIGWADQTALALHGARSLRGLGGTVAGYVERFELRRDGQTLEAAQYPLRRLLAGSEVDRLLIDVVRRRDGRRWVHAVRTRILPGGEGPGGDGVPDCLVLILDDQTERVEAEERFERTFAANPAPAIIVRLGDGRYVKVNRGFLELTGFRHAELIGRSMHAVDVLAGAEKRELAVARLHAGETIPQMEGKLPTADGTGRTVLLSGQPLEVGDARCMLFTFADLHPREQAHRALRHSEQRFERAFAMAPVPMAVTGLADGRMLDVNDAFTAACGWRREELLGRAAPGNAMWGEGEARREVERRIRGGDAVRGADVRFRFKDGAVGDFLLSAETVEIGGGRCVLSVLQDVSERRRTERELLEAVEATMQDSSWIGHRIVEKLTTISRSRNGAGNASASAEPGATLADLPARALEVLDLMAAGRSDPEIAARLGIARNTLRNHVAAIYRRLGVRRRVAAVAWARDRGLGRDGGAPKRGAGAGGTGRGDRS